MSGLLLREAIEINNVGVALLLPHSHGTKHIAGALRAFRSAVVLLKHATAATSGNAVVVLPENDHVGANARRDSARGVVGGEEASTTTTGPIHFATGLLSNGASYFVYDRPFWIPLNNLPEAPEHFDSAVLAATTATVLFNFALACHLSGILSGQQERASLDRAERLYALALQILASSAPSNTNRIDRVDAVTVVHQNVLRCLALNNLSQLHYNRCNFAGSTYCLEALYYVAASTECLFQAGLNYLIVHRLSPTAASAA